MRKIILFVFIFLVSSFASAGEISGTIFLQGKTNSPLKNTIVRLHVYKEDFEFSGAETTTDSSGRYSFRNLQTGSDYGYILYPIHGGVNYPYAEVVFSGASTVKKDFILSPATGSNKNIAVDESVFFEFGKKDVWKVTHEIILENKGDELYHGDLPNAGPLQFSLFEGGFDLAYLDGITRQNSKIDDGKDVLQAYLTLGAHQQTKLKFSYYFIPDKRNIKFDREAMLGRSNISLFFNKRVGIVSKQFQADPMLLKAQPGYLTAFSSGPIAQNEKITFVIKGFYLKRDFLHMIVFSACIALLVFLVLWSLVIDKPRKNQRSENVQAVRDYVRTLQKKYGAGEISEAEFKKEDYRIRNFLFQHSKSGGHDRF